MKEDFQKFCEHDIMANVHFSSFYDAFRTKKLWRKRLCATS